MGIATLATAQSALPKQDKLLIGEKNLQREITFSPEDITKLKENLDRNLTSFAITIEANGFTCCGPVKKLSKCIWSCCDGKTVNACGASPDLQEIISVYFKMKGDSTQNR